MQDKLRKLSTFNTDMKNVNEFLISSQPDAEKLQKKNGRTTDGNKTWQFRDRPMNTILQLKEIERRE